MEFRTLKISGRDAIRLLNEHRSRYLVTGEFPFLIGETYDLARIEETAGYIAKTPSQILRVSLGVQPAEWIAKRCKKADPDTTLEVWPAEVPEPITMGLHKVPITGDIKDELYLGLANIERPWHLSAVLKYGGWNACPDPVLHCAFHRQWEEKFGAEITGVAADVIEFAVMNPPADREAATTLAWEQYWYCPDIVEQGCRTISNLAATLLNSRHWFFWWD